MCQKGFGAMENARSLAIITSITSTFFQPNLITGLRIWCSDGRRGKSGKHSYDPEPNQGNDVFIPRSNLLIYLDHHVDFSTY